MFDWIDDMFAGVGNTFSNLYQGVSNAFGSLFGTGGGSIPGSVGGTMTRDMVDDALAAYTRAGYTTDQALSFISQGTGNSLDAVKSLVTGLTDLPLVTAPQVAFSPATMSTAFNMSNENIANLMKAGMGIYGLMTADSGTSPQQARTNADPYAPYRAEAAARLNEVLRNPSLAYSTPGYQARQQMDAQALARLAGSQGIRQSGQTQQALQQQYLNTANDWFNNYVKNLSTLSGASQSPAYGQEAAMNTTQQENKARTAALQTLMQSVGGLVTGGFFG